jgi:hypothetical protein
MKSISMLETVELINLHIDTKNLPNNKLTIPVSMSDVRDTLDDIEGVATENPIYLSELYKRAKKLK